MRSRTCFGFSLVSVVGVVLLPLQVQAQEAASFPSEQVHLIVPFAAGGATDVATRLIAEKLSERWRKPVIVENKAGATGAIAAEYVKRAAADGYTMLVGTGGVNSVLPAFKKTLPFNTVRDFAAVSQFYTTPNVLVVHPSLPPNTVTEFIELLKANPGQYDFASSGIGSAIHLTGELFQQMTGTRMVHVPYKGSAPAMTDLLAGHVKVMFDNLASAWPQVQTGRLRALGVTSSKRDPLAPAIPAIAETVPGFDVTVWVGLLAPAGTPARIINKISDDVRAALKTADVSEKLRRIGATPIGDSPENFSRAIKEDLEKWRGIVEKGGVERE
jgi:tripartite-type tricarboxylate transporter receptor subunit TctC